MEDDRPPNEELPPRQPTVEDLWNLRRELNVSEAKYVVIREVDGVPIPFTPPRLLWRMKAVTHREKDADDLVFLRTWFAEREETPAAV